VSDALFDRVEIVTPEQVGRYSRIQRLALAGGRDAIAELDLTEAEVTAMNYAPEITARPIQQPRMQQPGRTVFFFCGGRGAGKTWTGSLMVNIEASLDPDARILIIGPSYSEVVKNQIEGLSGVLALCPPWFRPKYRKAARELRWPNGALATWMPAQNPDKLRGFASTMVWADELVAWKREPLEVYNEMFRVNRVRTRRMAGIGLEPRVILTTTPKPLPIFRHMLERDAERMVMMRSPTLDNADNLDPSYARLARRLAHTTEGQREYAGLLTFGDLDAAIFRAVDWDKWRVTKEAAPERFDFIAIGVDPATGDATGRDKRRDHTGLCVVGFKAGEDKLRHAYVLASRAVPVTEDAQVWAKQVVDWKRAWEPHARKTMVLSESNAGGNLVRALLRQFDARIPVQMVRAVDQKADRARAWSPQAEAGFVHLVGVHAQLEKQLMKFSGGVGTHGSDDLLDALSWPLKLYLVPVNRGALAEPTAAEESSDASSEA